MWKVLLFLILFISAPLSLAQTDASGNDFFSQGMRPAFMADVADFAEVPQYIFHLALIPDFTQAKLTGTLDLTYTNTTPDALEALVFRLYANLESFGGQAAVSNVTVNGVSVNGISDETGSIVTIPLPQPLLPGEKLSLLMDYAAVVFHGEQHLYNQFSYLETELALASALPLLSVYNPSTGWWREVRHPRGDAVFSETANFDVTLTAPSYLKVITSGSLIEQTESGGMVTLRYAAPLMRDFSIMASAQYETLSSVFDDIQVNVHYLPGKENSAELAMQWVLDSMAAFTNAYGAYVYKELDLVETYTSAGGIEYPGLIVVADDIWRLSDPYFQIVTVHEVAHQWWYSMVGNDQTLYPWLDEALTEYSVAVYWRHVAGENGYNTAIRTEQGRYREFEGDAGAMKIGFAPSDYNDVSYSSIVYGKGAYFFHVLSVAMGQENFAAAIQNYLESYRYRIATPFDLQSILEDAAGVQFDDLFLEWVGYSN